VLYRIFFTLLLICTIRVQGQTLGGNSLYNFLKLPNAPQLTALGGINVSQFTQDIGMVFHSPALLEPSMHGQSSFVFNAYFGGIRQYHAITGYHVKAAATTLALGVHYFDYGQITRTDVAGNVLGLFRPLDYVVQATASRSYLRHWHYGMAFKFLRSSYGPYASSAVALDMGVTYADTASGWKLGLNAMQMGAVLQKFSGTDNSDLPFDLRFGISKKLRNAPLQFSLTAHHLHQGDITYEDTASVYYRGKAGWADRIFRHLVFAVQGYVSNKIELSAGYDFLRRRELNIAGGINGWNGFSLGMGVTLKRWQFRYARTYFQSAQSSHQVGINLQWPGK
jgi:hypothetical protein